MITNNPLECNPWLLNAVQFHSKNSEVDCYGCMQKINGHLLGKLYIPSNQ